MSDSGLQEIAFPGSSERRTKTYSARGLLEKEFPGSRLWEPCPSYEHKFWYHLQIPDGTKFFGLMTRWKEIARFRVPDAQWFAVDSNVADRISAILDLEVKYEEDGVEWISYKEK